VGSDGLFAAGAAAKPPHHAASRRAAALLRTAAVLLFGLALARPYFATRAEEFDERQPLHAVIVIDNSLSMGYESLEGSLLDKAKDRRPADRQAARRQPHFGDSGLRIGAAAVSPDPYDTKEAALEALNRIGIVDRSASLAAGRQRCPQAARQRRSWPSESSLSATSRSSTGATSGRATSWSRSAADAGCRCLARRVGEHVDCGPAGAGRPGRRIETPTTIVVEVAHRGRGRGATSQVTLSMGDTVIGQKTVTIEPGLGTREIDFECVFNTLGELPEPDRPVFVPIRASISPDRLAADDERLLAVPVVAALPVVFVDQYGPDLEDPIRGRLGETRHLRKLLAPKTSRSDAPRQLISVRHVTPAELSQDLLADARLVVVAGLPSRARWSAASRYVRQGGQLVIAAGASFDPAAWNEAAWLEGAGILPLPLAIGADWPGARSRRGESEAVLPVVREPEEPAFRLAGRRRSCATCMPSRSSSRRSKSTAPPRRLMPGSRPRCGGWRASWRMRAARSARGKGGQGRIVGRRAAALEDEEARLRELEVWSGRRQGEAAWRSRERAIETRVLGPLRPARPAAVSRLAQDRPRRGRVLLDGLLSPGTRSPRPTHSWSSTASCAIWCSRRCRGGTLPRPNG
jgi:hypothetical protein